MQRLTAIASFWFDMSTQYMYHACTLVSPRGHLHMYVLALANNKGGVGKTTLTVNLAHGFSIKEFAGHKPRVLVVDLDGQSQSTKWWCQENILGPTSFEALTKGALAGPPAQVPGRENLWILPATDDLHTADLDLARSIGGTSLLSKSLRSMENDFDIVLLDCPPSLGLVVASALCAADAVIAPVFASDLALQGLARMEEALTQVRERLNSHVEMLGYVLVGADNREKITHDTRKVLTESAPHPLFKSEVRLSTAAKSLQSRGLTVFDQKSDPRGAEDYPALVDEIASKLFGSAVVAA